MTKEQEALLIAVAKALKTVLGAEVQWLSQPPVDHVTLYYDIENALDELEGKIKLS